MVLLFSSHEVLSSFGIICSGFGKEMARRIYPDFAHMGHGSGADTSQETFPW